MAEYNQCWFCGRYLKYRDRTIDHVCPYSAGGEKMVTACKDCNNLKADMDLESFRTLLGVTLFYGEAKGWKPW